VFENLPIKQICQRYDGIWRSRDSFSFAEDGREDAWISVAVEYSYHQKWFFIWRVGD